MSRLDMITEKKQHASKRGAHEESSRMTSQSPFGFQVGRPRKTSAVLAGPELVLLPQLAHLPTRLVTCLLRNRLGVFLCEPDASNACMHW